MRISKKIPKIIALSFSLLIIIWIGLTINASVDKTDSFFVRNATIQDFGHLERVKELEDKERRLESVRFYERVYGVGIHRISSGNGLVLGYRWYSNGELNAIDDEFYKKLTIFIPSDAVESGKVYDLSNQPVVVLYSSGGSAWPRSGCHGFIVEGWVVFRSISTDRIEAELDAKKLSSPLGIPTWCNAKDIPLHFKFKRLEFSELT